MKRIFILEDDMYRILAFRQACVGMDLTVAMSCPEAYKLFKPPYDIICLDHDLGGQQMVESGANTGYEFAETLTKNPTPPADYIVIHSYNPEGALNMERILRAGFSSVYVGRMPFGPSLLTFLQTFGAQ